MKITNNLAYEDRANLATHPLAKHLFHLMASKKSNLALAADVTRKEELLALADQCGPEICVFKTHIDVIEDFDLQLVKQLQELAKKHQFLIFEDRKFADIGHTVQLQYQAGVYHIANWADIVNAHSLPGPGIVEGLKKVGMPLSRGLLLLAEMSSKGNLINPAYTEATLALAKQHKDFVIGFIAQHRLSDDPDFIYLTPGVGLAEEAEKLGQNYLHPTKVIVENGCDIIIVGRGIYRDKSPRQAAQQFRELGWQAYQQRSQMHGTLSSIAS